MLQTFRRRADQVLRAVSPSFRAKRKYEGEIQFWHSMRGDLHRWFTEKSMPDYWGVTTPTAPVSRSASWLSNAIQTLHAMRPSYLEALRLPADAFAGQRVLEVGCGPLVPGQVFLGCELHALDPLIDQYITAGFPLFDFPVRSMSAPAEAMPYPDGYFDAVISVNALDHVDDFERAAAEIERVLRPGGRLAIEVEYHQPTQTEPLVLSDARMRSAFAGCDLTKVVERSARAMYEAMVDRFNLKPSPEVVRAFKDDTIMVTWHGVRREAIRH